MRFRLDVEPWKPLENQHVVGVVLFAGLVIALLIGGDSGWTPILDSANLAFHEAGHMFYGILGDTMALYGGVLGQLTFPLAAMAVFFFWRREAHGFAASAVWAAQNLFNIARYMADARAQELPLVGGGEHDFEHIFTRWGALHRDVAIAEFTRTLGWIGILAAIGWLLWRHRHQALN